jgi:S-methylmethionine-dependent homocysteine/selenocysteine methylase
MTPIKAIQEAISELTALAETEMNTFEYNRLRLIIQELEKAESMLEVFIFTNRS